MITDIQNPCPQKFTLQQNDPGRLVRVDELNEEELEQVYYDLSEPVDPKKKKSEDADYFGATPMVEKGCRLFGADARKLMYTDRKTRVAETADRLGKVWCNAGSEGTTSERSADPILTCVCVA